MEDVLIYAIIFAGLLGAGAPLRRCAERVLESAPPWAPPVDLEVTIHAPAIHVDDLRDLPRARQRPFDRCWPGTDVPKAGL